MGFFNFFSKNKEQQKETLDKGLEKTKECRGRQKQGG